MCLSCAKSDEGGNDDAFESVNVRFIFSLHRDKKASTRMTSDVVQQTGMDRGIDDARVLCYNGYPTASSKKIGGIIEMKNDETLISSDSTSTEISEFREVGVPVGTTHFGFYGTASGRSMTHEDRMKNGIIEVVGLSKSSYTDNSGIRFKPVQICQSDDKLGDSEIGERLLTFLNELMAVCCSDAAPNDRWPTAANIYLNEAYKRMTELKTLSSQHVAVMLAAINRMVSETGPSDPGRQLAEAIIAKITSVCTEAPDLTATIVQLKEAYQGFPDDLHLPVGAARIEWDTTQGKYVVPDVQTYGKNLNIRTMDSYCYPMNLQYQVLSDIVASDEKVVLVPDDGGDGGEGGDGSGQTAQEWQKLIDELYSGASSVVQSSTQSVAMKQQVNYAVGKLALRSRIATSDNMYDAKGQLVNVSKGFTLKGYIIGGQHEVDYNFQRVGDTKEFAIYDTDLNGGPQRLKRHDFTEENFVLGLGTGADEPINIALELVNEGNDFQGADGVIAHGATFYLVASLVPRDGTGYTSGSIDQIFCRDRATTVSLTIEGGYPDTNGDGLPDTGIDEYGRVRPVKGLATATYGLPNLDVPHPTVGLSVNLRWEEGLWFDDIIL